MALKRIGQILVDLGLIDEQQLATMLEEQSNRGGELLGKIGVAKYQTPGTPANADEVGEE